jgi:hypothetical protein
MYRENIIFLIFSSMVGILVWLIEKDFDMAIVSFAIVFIFMGLLDFFLSTRDAK